MTQAVLADSVIVDFRVFFMLSFPVAAVFLVESTVV